MDAFVRHEEENLDAETALALYQETGFLWVRLSGHTGDCTAVLGALRGLFVKHQSCFKRHWSVENSGELSPGDLGPETVLGCGREGKGVSSPFYVSAILQRNPPALSEFFSSMLPFNGESQPRVLGASRHDDGCWLFIGKNEGPGCKAGNEKLSKKRKLSSHGKSLEGRVEHVDDVDHAGTWHAQLAGTKTWRVRPNPKAHCDWSRDDVNLRGSMGPIPDISTCPHAEKSTSGGRAMHLKCVVEAGDIFVLNTRAWFHRTELEPSEEWSVSVARDFYLDEGAPAPLLCPRDMSATGIIFEEEDIPDDIPRSSNPNCSLAQLGGEGKDDEQSGGDNDVDDDEEGVVVMIALRDIKAGEQLFVADDNDDNDGSDCPEEFFGKCNGAACIDPRAIATRDFFSGSVVLSGDDIPEDLPCSHDPTCELIGDGDEGIVLVALRDLASGGVLCVAPVDGESYKEVEVDLASGELV